MALAKKKAKLDAVRENKSLTIETVESKLKKMNKNKKGGGNKASVKRSKGEKYFFNDFQ